MAVVAIGFPRRSAQAVAAIEGVCQTVLIVEVPLHIVAKAHHCTAAGHDIGKPVAGVVDVSVIPPFTLIYFKLSSTSYATTPFRTSARCWQ